MLVKVPENYMWLLRRYDFEYTHIIDNLAFMLYYHKDDVSFLESDIFDSLMYDVEEKFLQKMICENQILVDLKVPTGANFVKNYSYITDEKDFRVSERHEEISFVDAVAHMYSDTVKTKEQLTRCFTFQVTENCNLACTYCYQTHKTKKVMSMDTAKKVVDMLLTGACGFKQYFDIEVLPAIVIDFIGGEPLLQIDLIDEIITYFRYKAITEDSHVKDTYRFSMCSNGVLYDDPKVKQFLTRNKFINSFSVTVDGTKQLHDTCRLFPDGSPSYDIAHKAAQDWMSRGNYIGSKITLAQENVMYLCDCLLALISDGYYDINANCVYEAEWNIQDANILYNQIKRFADIFHSKYFAYDYDISLLNPTIGKPKKIGDDTNWCGGTGSMLSVDPDGNYFPCIRYMESSLNGEQKPLRIGSVTEGLCQLPEHSSCIECLNKIDRRTQSTDECYYCPIADGCAWCSGYNYQCYGTADKRCTKICIMHKARVLGVNYFWNTFYKKNDIQKVVDLYVPKDWVIEIIGEQEYILLKNLTTELGGYVNRDVHDIRRFNNEQIHKTN